MIRSVAMCLTLAAFAAGCQQDKEKPAWDQGRPSTPDKPGATTTAPTGSLEERVAKLERRLDKITGFLRQAVRPELDTTVSYAVPIDPADPVLGPADAKVTIVEAYEYKCPYCQLVAPSIDKMLEEFPKDVRVVHKYFLIHGAPAMPSGQAACAAAKQGKFKEYSKTLWQKVWPVQGQRSVDSELTAEAMEKNAQALGLDVAKFKVDMEGECRSWVERSSQTLQKFGAGGTPSFYINGRFAQGDPASFKRVIEEEIKKVDESGVKPADYYEKVVLTKGEKQAKMISPFDEE